MPELEKLAIFDTEAAAVAAGEAALTPEDPEDARRVFGIPAPVPTGQLGVDGYCAMRKVRTPWDNKTAVFLMTDQTWEF